MWPRPTRGHRARPGVRSRRAGPATRPAGPCRPWGGCGNAMARPVMAWNHANFHIGVCRACMPGWLWRAHLRRTGFIRQGDTPSWQVCNPAHRHPNRSRCMASRGCWRWAFRTDRVSYSVRADARVFAVGRGAGPWPGPGGAADRQARWTLEALEPVGNYAVQPHFSDGHDTGIFSWDYLYFLGRRKDQLWAQYTERLEQAGRRPGCGHAAAGRPRVRQPLMCSRGRCFSSNLRQIPHVPARVVVAARPIQRLASITMTTTHFGFESVDEADKARRVRGVFDSVAPKYDLMNDLMSAGLHRAWKAYTVMVADVREGQPRCWTSPGAPATWPRLLRAGRRSGPGRVDRHQRGDAAHRSRPPARRRLRHRCAGLRRREAALCRRPVSTVSAWPSACAT
jgi:hypothetical protein